MSSNISKSEIKTQTKHWFSVQWALTIIHRKHHRHSDSQNSWYTDFTDYVQLSGIVCLMLTHTLHKQWLIWFGPCPTAPSSKNIFLFLNFTFHWSSVLPERAGFNTLCSLLLNHRSPPVGAVMLHKVDLMTTSNSVMRRAAVSLPGHWLWLPLCSSWAPLWPPHAC